MADAVEENIKDEDISQRHKRERKELQGDKKKKKEVTLEIAKIEADQENRHKQEQEKNKKSTEPEFQNETSRLSEKLEETHISSGCSEEKVSRAQKRRVKKASKENEREQRIAAADLENVNSARNVEAMKIKQRLKEINLEIVEILPDGHCLYNAVADQMKRRNKEIKMLSLRQQTADYMSSHSEDFLPFLTHPDTGDMYTPEQFSKYCEDIAETSVWGGQLELRALSHVLRLPIEILQADAPAIKIGEEFEEQPITLSYHRHAYGLGEHYNSVTTATPINKDDGSTTTPIP
ncbi:deubiquitinase OTUD6B isoform X2 [Nematostella vectensis]|uniref:deubiquitinase OTUD6B isoform X2 n=1 Tax=Nematostella vectensis TaxID=45351 RepID=UPI0020775171|nr:deubiquitinase OTUD6B isoform X2 [Nematostella vectensis]